jgi:hypothetical protein
MAQERFAEAEEVTRDALPMFEALGDEYYIALATTTLAGTAFAQGDLDRAVDLGMRGLLSNHAMGDVASITLALLPTATLMFVAGLPGDAATIYAAYEAHCRRYGVWPPLDVEDWMGLSSVIEAICATVEGDAFEHETRLGASMTTDGVIEFLLGEAVPRFKARSGAAVSAPAS